MLTLPTKFQDELNKAVNTPSFLVKLEDGTLYNEQTLGADWAANTQASQIDYLTQEGSVLIEINPKPENLSGDHWAILSMKSLAGTVTTSIAWQSFQQTTSGATTLQTIKGFFKKLGAVPTLYCQLFAADKVTPIGTSVSATVTSTAGEVITFDFASQSLSISTATTYWIKFYTGVPAATGTLKIWYSSVSAYSNGQMTLNSTPTGDAYFQVSMGGFYKPSGYIRTRTMDIGSTPAETGEWVLEDIKPTGTTLTYQAWASATGAFTGEETDLGAIVDGDAITNLKRYYRVKATLTSNGDQSVSPTLQSIKADFTTYKTYSDNPSLGHETAILSVSSLSSSIDTFKPSTVGQITFSLNLSPSVSNYLATKKPKNKLVQVKAGFVADGFLEADYIDYSWGQIDDWKITSKDEVTLTVKDFSKEWDVDVPKAETGQALPIIDDWGKPGLDHPIDVMLDILKNHINARDSKILGSSFGTVKTALSGWIVNRTLKEDTVSAKDLMEELRLLTQTYFLPQANGKIKIKRWNADESSIDTLTDADFKSKRWDSYAKGIINRYTHFYGWDGQGDDAADYDTVSIGIDTTSQTEWNETTSKELKDKWTPPTQTTQVSDFLDKIMKRYANPPSMLYAEVDLRKMALEVGDIVTVTTSRAPSTDMAGISNIKFQIVNRNLDYSKHTLSLTMLECASSVNTQVESPVAQPTPYDLPDHVEGLAIVEQEYTNKDGFYTPLIVVTYDLPSNATYWSHALIEISIDGGSTYKSYGLDYNEGNGFIIDASKVGGFVGGTFEVRVISINTNGIAAPSATAPTASLAQIGETTVLTEPPKAIRGLAIEGNPDPNNTVWEGLRFALTWWKSSQTGGAGVEGGLGAGGFVDPYWNGDEYELWVSGTCIDSGMTKEARYDYIYGDGYLDYLDDKIAAASGTVTFKVRRVSLNLASEWSTITITQAAPANPAGLTGEGMSRSVLFTWNMSADTDFDYYSIRTKIGSGGAWSGWSSISGNSYLRTFTQAELTGGSLAVYIEVKAVDLYGNMSGAASTNAATWMIVPDELYTTLRTDFWVRDSIFYFNVATLTWTVGSITRAAETFTLAAATLATANNKYVIATLSGGVATLSLADMTAGIPALNANQIIIATTSYAPNTAGNYLCFIRQANSMMIEGAIIRDATITNAKIADLNADKITAGSIVSQTDPTNNYWNLTTGAIKLTGQITITSGSSGYTNFGDKPTSLSGINSGEGTKLSGIATGATANSSDATLLAWGNHTGRPVELTDGRVATALNAAGTVVTKVVPASVAGPGAAGLYLGSDYLGYYNGTTWKTYMQNNGNFYLSGTGTHALTWDGATLTVRGSLNADDITAGTITGRTLQTAASGQRMIIGSATNDEMLFYASDGTTLLGAIGIKTSGGDTVIGLFGSSGSAYVGVKGIGSTTNGVMGISTSGAGVYGSSNNYRGVSGVSDSGNGVVGVSTSAYGVAAVSSTGPALFVSPVTSAPTTNANNGGIYYNSTDHKFYGRANGAWVAFH